MDLKVGRDVSQKEIDKAPCFEQQPESVLVLRTNEAPEGEEHNNKRQAQQD
jgi:hypothetical protein